MDSLSALIELIAATLGFNRHWPAYQNDLRGVSPARKVTIALLLLAIFICVVLGCMMTLSMNKV